MFKQLRMPVCVLACLIVISVLTRTSGQQPTTPVANGEAAPAVAPPAAATTVELHLKIRDPASGLTLEAKKDVPKDTSAFDALRHIVIVDYTHYPTMGAFVTGLCGVDAPKDYFWALYVNGTLSTVGISSIKLEKDTLIEWKMEAVK